MNNKVLVDDIKYFAKDFELSERLRGKVFLITGATGLIGSVMTKCLLELNTQKNLGIKVLAAVRSIEKAKKVFCKDFSKIEFKEIDLSDIGTAEFTVKPDFLVHLACPTASKYFVEHPVETLRTAFEGTTTMLEYARNTGVEAMVYASSLEVYGSNMTDEWLDEDFQGYVNPIEVRSSYNMGKRAAECLCHSYAMEYGVPVMIARMTQTFGAGVEYNDNRVFAQFAKKAIEGEDIEMHTTGETSRMYCYTTDAVSAMLYLLIRGKRGEAYNIANKESYITIRNMAQMICDKFNPNITVKIVLKENQGYAPVTKLKLDTKRIEELGWSPKVSLVDMFDHLIRSMS